MNFDRYEVLLVLYVVVFMVRSESKDRPIEGFAQQLSLSLRLSSLKTNQKELTVEADRVS